MSMTREEAIDILENEKMCVNNETCQREECATCSLVMDKDKILTALDMALSALRPVSREPLEKFKEYFDDLYGKGLKVYGWHMNGEAKSFDDFYEDACEYAGL